jgi:hypothetical protein
MSKIDFKQTLKQYYQPPGGAFTLVDVPAMQFLMVDGQGDPNTAVAYQEALQALYAVAFKLKFLSKNELGRDYVVPPLEGLWWAQDMASFALQRDKNAWLWTMMIMAPDWIGARMFETAVSAAAKGHDLPGLARLRLATYGEGLAVQIMHTGSFEDEAPMLRRLHEEFLPANDLAPNGKHHEIYLSDPRRVAPQKLKTVLRQPVREVST